MKLYHGPKEEFVAIERRQASKGDHLDVPEKELLEAIYLMPDYGFAFACAARPEGVTDIDNESRTISFENPESSDPEQIIRIYEVDGENIPEKDLVEVDGYRLLS